jgi:hypothetical protein
MHLLDEAATASKGVVDEQPPAAPCRDLGNGMHRVEDAAGRLAMDREDMRDGSIRREGCVQRRKIRRRVLRRLQRHGRPARDVEDLPGAMAIGTVHQKEAFAPARHEGGEHGFHCEGA